MTDDYGGTLERLIGGGDDYGAVSLSCCCGCWHRGVDFVSGLCFPWDLIKRRHPIYFPVDG